MTFKIPNAALIFASAAALAAPAFAHHSFADFDRTKHGTVTGTVRALEWENPHIWLWVNTIDAKGNVVPWGFEGSAPAEMAQRRQARASPQAALPAYRLRRCAPL